MVLMVTGLSMRLRVHASSQGAGADPARHLGEVVGRMQHVQRLAPPRLVDEVVPVRDDVVDGAPFVAEGDPAVHAARPLPGELLVRQPDDELAPVPYPLLTGR